MVAVALIEFIAIVYLVRELDGLIGRYDALMRRWPE
jgi:hypothetical protein